MEKRRTHHQNNPGCVNSFTSAFLSIIFLNLLLLNLTACQTTHPLQITDLEQITGPYINSGPSDLGTNDDGLKLDQTSKDQMGYFLYDPQSHRVMEHHNEDRYFIPASTSKVPTTIAALTVLGANYRFKTYLSYQGKVKNNVLEGDLYLKGTGDPSLKTVDLVNLAENLAEKGIQRISGHFYYDESALVSEEAIENDHEPWAPFNTGISALSVDFNQFRVEWYPQEGNTKYRIYSIPDFSFIHFGILNQKLSNETHFIYKKDKTFDYWLLAHDLIREGKERLPLKNPGLATAELFAYLCQIENIKLPQPRIGKLSKTAKVIAIHESAPLVEIVENILEYSNNMMAELVQMATARALVKHPVSSQQASLIVSHWISQKILQEEDNLQNHGNPIELKRGSGLTSENRITPKQLVSILNYADHLKYDHRNYESLLGISGNKGDIANRLTRPGLVLRLRAKAGSMNYTFALTGYLHTFKGKKLIFAMMNTNFKERKLLDQTTDPLSDEQLRKVNTWKNKARQIQDTLLTHWMTQF